MLFYSCVAKTFERQKGRFPCCCLHFEQGDASFPLYFDGDSMSRRATKSRAARRNASLLSHIGQRQKVRRTLAPRTKRRHGDFVCHGYPPRVAAIPNPPRHAGGERRQPTESNGNSFLGNSLPEIYGRNWPSRARSDQRAIHLLELVQPDCASGHLEREREK